MSIQSDSRLRSLGWDQWFEDRFAPMAVEGLLPARVAADFGAEYEVNDGHSLARAVASRDLRDSGLPAVGDWVGLRHREAVAVILTVVERRSEFSRKVAGLEWRQQVMAANIDVAFVVASAQDAGVRRIERYLAMAWQSGAMPVVVLTKADLSPEAMSAVVLELEMAAAGTPVIVTSSVTGEGVEAVGEHLLPARTGVLLGPSGVGKSSLINRLAGDEVMRTKPVYRTGEGRHMTSHRQLVELPGGGSIIDTPGLREAQLWGGDGALDHLFEDIEDLARQCRFTDCEHRSEPDCAVKAALADGRLDAGRFVSYRKLERELRAVAARSDARLRADERRKWKLITMANRERDRYLRRG